MGDTLHIVSFDVPYPPDYGGAIDVMYKIRALAEEGARIHLHCFRDKRGPAQELEELCERVDYYPRRTRRREHLSRSPYIVNSRRSKELKRRILEDPGPILFEGLHTCHPLADPDLRELPKWVRTHNIEHEYYKGLMASTRSMLKKRYYQIEAAKLKRFESILTHADLIWAINPHEKEHFEQYAPTIHLPPFHPYREVGPSEEDEGFALYHGKLSVPENERGALFLVDEVFSSLESELVIAGDGASSRLLERIEATPNVRYEEGGSPERIDTLVQQAHINILATFQATGIKLKLLAALFKGRHCIVNPPMVEKTGLESLCHIGESSEELQKLVESCSQEPFDPEVLEKRREFLCEEMNDRKNAELLLKRPEWPLQPSSPRI